MNKKGFSVIGVLVAVVILLFVVHFAMKQYKKSFSNVSSLKRVGVNQKTGKSNQAIFLRDGILLKAGVLPQLDNLLREQQTFFSAKGTYAKNISDLGVKLAPTPQYVYGVSDNSEGWVVWVRKAGGNNKFLVSKNIKTKQLCCTDLDAGACQNVPGANGTCPFK